MHRHTGMEAHDGYEPHSHEVRHDHLAVKRAEFPGTSDRNEIPIPAGWALYYDGELVFSVDKDKWDQIGPAVKKIMEGRASDSWLEEK